jgi:AraC-like DNA-binding protein
MFAVGHLDAEASRSGASERPPRAAGGVYREARPAADLGAHVLRVWYRRIGEHEAADVLRIVPDGCMDLMWLQGELVVAGPDTTAWVGHLPAGTEIVGLRFQPGAAPVVLGVPAAALVDDRLAAAVVAGRWAHEVSSRLAAVPSVAAATVTLQDAVRQRLPVAPALDPIVQHVVQAVRRAPGCSPAGVAHLADAVGLSERQLHRRCCAALGYGPKTFVRIVRFQRFLAAARAAPPRTLAHLAAHSGYADQSHLTREVRRLAGLPPSELVARPAR